MPVRDPATLLLLAGGSSRRMGRPKARLPVGDTTLVEWVAARLAPAFSQLLVSARDEAQIPERLRAHVVRDRRPGAGPLAGIEAGLAATPHEVLVAVACDMPWVEVGLARRLVQASRGHDAAVPRLDGRPEPVCAAYRRSAAAPIGRALDAGRLRAAQALEGLDVHWLEDAPAEQLGSLNTPEDYGRFLDALRKKEIIVSIQSGRARLRGS
jgi:molybdopterin-guanine dinucleotide biosynthesis protein A